MRQSTIRQSTIRLAALAAIAASLLLSSGLTATAQGEVGLRACDADACNVVTSADLAARRAERGLTIYRPMRFPADRFSPHLTP